MDFENGLRVHWVSFCGQAVSSDIYIYRVDSRLGIGQGNGLLKSLWHFYSVWLAAFFIQKVYLNFTLSDCNQSKAQAKGQILCLKHNSYVINDISYPLSNGIFMCQAIISGQNGLFLSEVWPHSNQLQHLAAGGLKAP